MPTKAGGVQQISYKSIVDVVKSVAPRDKVSQYSSHSFRRGGASFMHSVGMSMDQIRYMGDWRSDCFRRYIVVDSAIMTHKVISTMQHQQYTFYNHYSLTQTFPVYTTVRIKCISLIPSCKQVVIAKYPTFFMESADCISKDITLTRIIVALNPKIVHNTQKLEGSFT